MILPGQYIRRHKGLIIPFHERSSAYGMTYGLSAAGYDFRIAETFDLEPGAFKLASSLERFNIPDDLLGIVHDKSTWARQGLAVQNTVFEPGWRGYATLELSNHSAHTLHIRKGMPIAQIVFHLLIAPTENPYKGKYQDQPAGAQEAILEAPSNLALEKT